MKDILINWADGANLVTSAKPENLYELMLVASGAMLTLIGLLIVGFIVAYIFMAIGLSKIAKRQGQTKSWIAWIPIVNSYLIGKIAISKTYGWVLLVFSVIYGLLDKESGDVFVKILGFIYFVCFTVAFYKIYAKLSNKAIVMTIFTVISCLTLSPVFIFAIRNNKMKKIEQATTSITDNVIEEVSKSNISSVDTKNEYDINSNEKTH